MLAKNLPKHSTRLLTAFHLSCLANVGRSLQNSSMMHFPFDLQLLGLDGKQLEVIVDAPDPEVPNHVLARGHADAPEIDCAVRLKGKNLRPGDLVDVKITAADGYDLAGRAVSAVR